MSYYAELGSIASNISSAKSVVTNRETTMRAGNPYGAVIATLPKNTVVKAITAGQPAGWAFVQWGSSTGFVENIALSASGSSVTSQITGALSSLFNVFTANRTPASTALPPGAPPPAGGVLAGIPTWAMVLGGAGIGYLILTRTGRSGRK